MKSTKPYFQIRSHPEVLRVWTSYLLGGDTVQPITRSESLSDSGCSCRRGLLMVNCNGMHDGRNLDGFLGGSAAFFLGLLSESL